MTMGLGQRMHPSATQPNLSEIKLLSYPLILPTKLSFIICHTATGKHAINYQTSVEIFILGVFEVPC